jgi:GAF domain-containing protein
MPSSAGPDELAAPLTALDRRHIGEIRVGGRDGRFTDVDRAVLVHLAQMTAAALERTRLYRTP